MKLKAKPVITCLVFFLVCCAARAVEYFVFRTDQTEIGEAIFHKIFGILLLAAALAVLGWKWRDIGFVAARFWRDIALGLAIGVGVFIVAYGTEMLMQSAAGNTPKLQFFVTSYAIGGNRALEGGFLLLALCIAGNLINVWMEEGVFRGLFPKLLSEKRSFWFACILSSLLFGIWHIAQPIRNAIDGVQSPMGALMMGLMLVGTSALLGVQYCMLNRVTGSIWAGMAAHFVNNTTINLLHVSTAGGLDEMQTLRITIAQTLSFLVVLVIYKVYIKKSKAAAR